MTQSHKYRASTHSEKKEYYYYYLFLKLHIMGWQVQDETDAWTQITKAIITVNTEEGAKLYTFTLTMRAGAI